MHIGERRKNTQVKLVELIVVGVLIGLGASLFLYKLSRVSATIDEPGSLTDGKYVVTNLRWDTVEAKRYPPLFYYLYGWVFKKFPEGDLDTQLFWARISFLPVYLIGALGMYVVVKRWYGGVAAIFALVIYLFNPEILAHSRMIKNDFLLAITICISLVTFYAFLRKPTPGRMILGGVSLALALLSKQSALILLPLYFVFGCLYLFTSTLRKERLLGLVGIFIVALVLLHAGYLFRETGRIPQVWQSKKLRYVASNPVIKPLLYLLPRAYVAGLDESTFNSERGWQGFWWGQYYEDGRWYYFPLVFLIKTPLPLLILIGVTLTMWIFRKLATPPLLIPLILLVVTSFFLYFMFFNKINHGLRYLLFVYPLLILLVAPLWNIEISKMGKVRRIWRGVIVVLLLWYVWGTVRIVPHYLAFANETIGGPKNLWKYVADSNIDWGQDGKFFEEYRKKHPELIVNPKEPTPGKIAVSVNMLNLDTHFETHWLRKLKLEPVDQVGYSWLVFEARSEDLKEL